MFVFLRILSAWSPHMSFDNDFARGFGSSAKLQLLRLSFHQFSPCDDSNAPNLAPISSCVSLATLIQLHPIPSFLPFFLS